MHSANLLDIAPTILTLFGLPVGGDMDGRPLVEAFTDRPTVQTISSWDDVPGRDGQHPEERKLDSDESREALEQLVALGYIERPAENQEKAVAQTVRELDYNLAMSYIDAGMHGRAAPILANLYRTYPLEFRFGIQLAMCLHTLGMTDDMSRLIDDLNTRWRKAAERARWRLAEVAEVAKQRRKEWREAKQEREEKGKQEGDDDAPSTPPQLFNEAEQRVVRSLRAIARGNEQTLDYLASSVAMSEKDYEKSLDHLQKARESETKTPGFHLQVGNAYLELQRYDDAETCYQRALELDPQNPNAHLELCRSALQRRRNRKALEAATTAVGLKFHFSPAHYFLGVARERMRDIDGAIESYERAVSQNPNFAEVHTRLAGIYQKYERNEEKAKQHRQLAREVRQERKRVRTMRILPDLPALDDAVIDENLPELPKLPQSNLKPPLGVAPVKGTEQKAGTDHPDGNGRPFITVVSGLPRSGTSMMMQMLAAGGLAPLTDDTRQADESVIRTHTRGAEGARRKYVELSSTRRAQDNGGHGLLSGWSRSLRFLRGDRLVPPHVVSIERRAVLDDGERVVQQFGHAGPGSPASEARDA